MAKVKYDAVATIHYTDKDGNAQKRYQKMGVVFESDKGLSAKIETVPVGWNGWISFYLPNKGDSEPKEKAAPPTRTPAKKTGGPMDDMDDGIPF